MLFKFTSWNCTHLNPKVLIQKALVILYARPEQLIIRRKCDIEADFHYKYHKVERYYVNDVIFFKQDGNTFTSGFELTTSRCVFIL